MLQRIDSGSQTSDGPGPGDRIGHYEIVRLIGAGGMGTVYLARDSILHRSVAIKLITSTEAPNSKNNERLFREARAAAALDHPNICSIYEIGEDKGSNFIVLQYIDGQTLAERLRSGPLSPHRAIEIAASIAEALAAAHARGIIHRDIKPENVMLTHSGQVKVMDFGLAKIAEETTGGEDETRQKLTASGMILGTVGYMSPEQARGEILDERGDIFSLGVVLFEMISGRRPFEAGSQAEILAAILTRDPPPLSSYGADVSTEFQNLVSKMLHKDRSERPATMRHVLYHLERCRNNRSASTLSAATERLGTIPQADRPRRTHRRSMLAACLAAVLSLATLGYLYFYRGPTDAAQIRSIAVMPFTNVSADPDTDFLSDGITDNIIERLSQIPNFKVMSHLAVFHYKGQSFDPRTIGSELGVEAVLTGRLVKRNDALTISLELVDARDNSHIWGEQYDRKLPDLLAVQREIPADVSDKLRLRLSDDTKQRLTREYTKNTEAYQLYLKGRYSWEKWSPEGSKQAVEFFKQAIVKDPEYALAYAGIADAYIFGSGVGPEVTQKEAHRLARDAATKALSLDPQLGEAHAAFAEVLLYDDWNFAGAERELERAIELNPSYAEGHHEYSHLLLLLGRPDQSLIESRKLLELDPISETSIGHLAYHYLYARQYDEAIQQFRKTIQQYPDEDAANHIKLGETYYQKGMLPEAIDEYLVGFEKSGLTAEKVTALREASAKSGIEGLFQKLLEQYKAEPQAEQDPVSIAKFYALLGENDHAFESLEKAYTVHADGLVRLKEELAFDGLRSDPRFTDLLRRIGLTT